ncbi:MAG: FixH family protein [Chitinophagales bacterium]
MKKFNWGWRIASLYIGFVLLILFLVYKTTTVKDDLVTPDYYAKELKYQDQLDKQKRTSQLPEQLTWEVNGKHIALKFPENMRKEVIKANILFYNPAEARKDVKLACTADSAGLCALNVEQIEHGAYQMKIDWTAGGISYFNEGTISIQ